MSLLRLSVKHGTTAEQARQRMASAVGQLQSTLAGMVQQVSWSQDGSRVKVVGPGVEVEMWVDDEEVHVTGNVPLLGPLLGGLRGMLEKTLQQRLK